MANLRIGLCKNLPKFYGGVGPWTCGKAVHGSGLLSICARNYATKPSDAKRITDLRNEVKIELMSEEDLKLFMTWADADNYNTPHISLLAQYRTAPHLAFKAVLREKTVGALRCSAWGDEEKKLFIAGNHYVKEGFRSVGIGHMLKKHMLALTPELGYPNFGANATPQRFEANYAAGMHCISPIRLLPFTGSIPVEEISDAATPPGVGILNYTSEMLDDLTQYDATVHAIGPRRKFLETCFESTESICKIAVNGSTIVGYGGLFCSADGWRLDPLYADSHEIALSLLKTLMTSIPKWSIIFATVPSTNDVMKSMMKRFGMKTWDFPYLYRMYTADDVDEDVPIEKVFTTFGCETTFL